jgi:hypothetical protein
MVEYTLRIDTIFSALADPIRRDILERTTVSARTEGMREAAIYLKQYEQLWTERLDAHDIYVKVEA